MLGSGLGALSRAQTQQLQEQEQLKEGRGEGSEGEQKHRQFSRAWQLEAAELGSELSCRPVELATRDRAAKTLLEPRLSLPGASRADLNPEL